MTTLTVNKIEEIKDGINLLLDDPDLGEEERKTILTDIVRENWWPLSRWANLDGAVISDVEKATVGSGVAMLFREDGVRKILLLQAGPHYPRAANTVLYTIPGGFNNLIYTKGSSQVSPTKKPENPRIAAAREVEEELQTAEGPLFSIDPDRLRPMDTDLIVLPWGEKRIVLGLMMELTADEVTKAKQHVQRLASDASYKEAAAARTINDETGKPEVIGAAIFDLDAAAAGHCPLLHEDQRSLFRAVKAYDV